MISKTFSIDRTRFFPVMTGRDKKVLFLILAFAAAVRIAYLYEIEDNPYFYHPIVDCKTYDEQAREIINEGMIRDKVFWQAPLYPYFLSAIYSIFGRRLLMVRVVQFLTGVAACALMFAATGLFSRKLSPYAASVFAFYGPVIFFEGELLAPVIIIPLYLLLIISAHRTLTLQQQRSAFFTGFLLGTAVIAHGPAAMIFPLLLLYFLKRHATISKKLMKRTGAFFSLGFSCLPLLVMAHNAAVGGELVFISSNAGINFYIGNHPDYDSTIGIRPGMKWQALGQEPQKKNIKKPGAQSRYFFNKALRNIKTDLSGWITLILRKSYLFFNGDEILRNQDIYPFRQYSRVLKILLWKRWGLAFPFGLLAGPALAGIAITLKNRKFDLTLLIFTGHFIGTILFFICSRYRLPVIPVMIIYACVWGRRLITALRSGKLMKSAALFIPVTLLILIFNRGVGPMSSEYTADSYFNLANVRLDQNRIEEAAELFRKALELDPEYVEAYNNLGIIYDQEYSDYDKAVEYYNEVLKRYPEDLHAHMNLGTAYYRLNRENEAVKEYKKALEISPNNPDALHNLAYVLKNSKDRTGKAGETPPGSIGTPFAEDNLLKESLLQEAETLRTSGRIREAVKVYRRILEIDPEAHVARHNLGVLLYRLKNYDEAQEQLRRVIEKDPGFIDAYNSLGVVFAARENYNEARKLWDKALELNPGYEKAADNLKQMDEMMREELNDKKRPGE